MFCVEPTGCSMQRRDHGAEIACFAAAHSFLFGHRKLDRVIGPPVQNLDLLVQFQIRTR